MKKYIKMLLSTLFVLLTLCSCNISFDNVITTPKGTLAVHFLDIGQGDSIFIELPNSQTMLVDAGENYYGEGIINYIYDCGYEKLDYLVATHPHSDHIGSMSYIVRHMDIDAVYMPKVSTTTKIYENLLDSISNKGLKIKTAIAGTKILDVDELEIDILAPVEIYEDDLNNCSVILKITYKDRSFLLTGDAEKKEFEDVYLDMSADVLKVAHHGSSTSTTEEILEKIKPEIAVISLGEDNEYGHPHKSTLKLLNNIDCDIYRTDEDKTVKISTDGENLEVETDRPSIERAK